MTHPPKWAGVSILRRMLSRAAYLAFALLVLGPLLPIPIEAVRTGTGIDWEAGRLASLALNTGLLAALVLALVLPSGLLFALLQSELSPRRRTILQAGLCFLMFIPLPVLASAWQAGLESGGSAATALRWLGVPAERLWQPWKRGFAVAGGIHALHLFPWVAFLFCRAADALPTPIVEEARMLADGRFARWKLLLPSLRPALVLAILWVVIEVATEIVVTDMAVVRTWAEEVYFQSVLGFDLGRESLRCLPLVLFLCLAAYFALRGIPVGIVAMNGTPGAGGAGSLLPPIVLLSALFTLPVFELTRQFLERSRGGAWQQFVGVVGTYAASFAWSAFNAALVGLVAAGFSILFLTIAQTRPRFGKLLFVIALAVACLPGPVLGFAAKKWFSWLCIAEESIFPGMEALNFALYDGPAALPVLWVQFLRFLPLALALVYASLSAIPKPLLETARLEGVSDGWRMMMLNAPAAGRSLAVAALTVALLAFGEVSAGKIVQTPGSIPFNQELFNQMHYGVSTTVAGMCLMQIAGQILMFAAVMWGSTFRPEPRPRA